MYPAHKYIISTPDKLPEDCNRDVVKNIKNYIFGKLITMLFNSSAFIILLIITFIFYYFRLVKKYQVQILIISSLFFYGYSQPALLALLLSSALINIVLSYAVVNGNQLSRRVYATTGVIINVMILIFFKYSALLAHTFLNTNLGPGQFLINIPLPIGISFYTFEGISLLVDVYSNKHADVLTIEKSFKEHTKKTLFFISFFPHLISGPILKAYEFYPQIGTKEYADIDWNYIFKRLIAGYFLKMVVADNLATVTANMNYPMFKVLSSVSLCALLLEYSFQIFADFAGYSLIALGLAKLFGYDLIENFNFPYISTSFAEFWRRWHISLSTFLKEYLYIPLGGNRKGRIRTYLNLTLTMILGGLWHGAAWSYAIWGLFHGLALAIERFITNNTSINIKGNAGAIVKGVITFSFVTLSWILFKLPFEYVLEYFRAVWLNRHMVTHIDFLYAGLLFSTPVVIYHLLYLLKQKQHWHIVIGRYQYLIYGLMLFLIIVNSGPSGSFIYFQF